MKKTAHYQKISTIRFRMICQTFFSYSYFSRYDDSLSARFFKHPVPGCIFYCDLRRACDRKLSYIMPLSALLEKANVKVGVYQISSSDRSFPHRWRGRRVVEVRQKHDEDIWVLVGRAWRSPGRILRR